MAVDVLSRIVHVATAITLVGGSVFMLLVLLPAAKTISTDAHDALLTAITTRWKRFIHVGILLFLVSGMYNYMGASKNHSGDGLYHGLLGIKMLLALGVFFIASALVGRSSTFEPMRKAKAKWLTVLVLLAVTIVCISGFVKTRGTPTVESPEVSTSQSLNPTTGLPI